MNRGANNAEHPSMATFNGALYLAWKESHTDSNTRIHVSRYNGTSWTPADGPDGYIYCDYTSNSKDPELEVCNGVLYLIWAEQNTNYKIYVKYYNGTSWTAAYPESPATSLNYDQDRQAYNPTLAVYNTGGVDKLYAAWEEDNGSGKTIIRVKGFEGGTTWTGIDGGGLYYLANEISQQPSMAAYGGYLYLTWTEDEAVAYHKIRLKKYDGTSWTDGGPNPYLNLSTGYDATSSGLIVQNDTLYLAWNEMNSSYIHNIRVKKYNNGSWSYVNSNGTTDGQTGINYSSSEPAKNPYLAMCNDQLYVSWQEGPGGSEKIRVKKYPLPRVESVTPPADATYTLGQSLQFTVNFNRNITVDTSGGTPSIPITLDTGGTVAASYVSGSTTSALIFSYTVQPANVDANGITVGSSINLNGGSFSDSQQNGVVLNLNNVGITAGVLVDSPAAGIASTNPTTLTEAATNNGSLTSGTVVISIANGTLADPLVKADVTASNLPGGMDYTLTRDNDTQLTVTISGQASNHANANDVSNLTFTIAGSKVTGATGDLTTGNITIDFSDPYPQVATPTATPGAGAVAAGSTVTLSTATAGASIYYTTDGTNPSSGSTLYAGAISITANVTLKAIAVKGGMSDSDILTAAYTILPPSQVATPIATPGAGAVAAGTTVTLSTATAGAVIYYTTDGSDPTTASTMYAAPIVINAAVTIKAFAVTAGMTDSSIMEAAYTVLPPDQVAAPTANPPAGMVAAGTLITLSTTTPGATIYYTTDGSEPSIGSSVYDPIIIYIPLTVKAIAVKPGMTDSTVMTAQYTILNSYDGGGASGQPPAPAPANSTSGSATVSPGAGGTISLGNDVSLSIPAHALSGQASLNVSIAPVDSPPPGSASFAFLSSIYSFTVGGSGHYEFSSPVTLTFTFDPSLLPPGQTPAVYYYNEAEGQWSSLGGVVSGNTISVDASHFTAFAVMAKLPEKPDTTLSFTDTATHWASGAINKLVGLGAVTGYADGTFKPDKTISRAEFAVMLAKALKLAPGESKVFGDTASHWAKDAIASVAEAGLVSGFSGGRFGPDDPITREQMAVMISNAARLKGTGTKLAFADSAQISSWASDAVNIAVQGGLMTGYQDHTFRPQALSTRAEAVTVIVNLKLII